MNIYLIEDIQNTIISYGVDLIKRSCCIYIEGNDEITEKRVVLF